MTASSAVATRTPHAFAATPKQSQIPDDEEATGAAVPPTMLASLPPSAVELLCTAFEFAAV